MIYLSIEVARRQALGLKLKRRSGEMIKSHPVSFIP